MIEGARAAPCPHHDARPDGAPIDLLVLTDSLTPSRAAALAQTRKQPAGPNWHYLIDADAGIWAAVPEARAARGLAGGTWRGRAGVAGRAVVVALVHPGGDGRDYGVLQMAAACDLSLALIGRHGIGPCDIAAHGDIAPALGRGPGDRFDWAGLAAGGAGLWPQDVPDLGTGGARGGARGGAVRDAVSLRDVRQALRDIGYALAAEGPLDPAMMAVLRSFQRRWRPEAVTGQADAGTLGRLLAVARLCAADPSRSDHWH